MVGATTPILYGIDLNFCSYTEALTIFRIYHIYELVLESLQVCQPVRRKIPFQSPSPACFNAEMPSLTHVWTQLYISYLYKLAAERATGS